LRCIDGEVHRLTPKDHFPKQNAWLVPGVLRLRAASGVGWAPAKACGATADARGLAVSCHSRQMGPGQPELTPRIWTASVCAWAMICNRAAPRSRTTPLQRLPSLSVCGANVTNRPRLCGNAF